jgi:hypothetical protein
MNLNLAIQLCKNMGTRYITYRVQHEIERKLGVLKSRHPNNLSSVNIISLAEWRKIKKPFVIGAKEDFIIAKHPLPSLEYKAKKILNGDIQFFNSKWEHLGKTYDWITNPSNGYRYDVKKHWSEIPDLSEDAGDIKFVWEKSRFSYILHLIRYDYHFNNDQSEYVFSEIESWIDSNPINNGPNWRCSQEISLRIFNWCYALYYYQHSPSLTEKRWQKIQQVIYASLHHVYYHIDFSRIAVRNNHAITETLFLALSNILFPFIPETRKWSKKGIHWFEKEIDYQIYDDGTFLQFSMNYHRVVIQLLSLGISLFEKNNQKLSSFVYEKAYKSVNFLYQCMQDETGWLPNYGSNDGALFFPFTESDYRDYRPQLNTLHVILTGRELFNSTNILEDYNWVNGKLNKEKFAPIEKKDGIQSFDIGGYYICRVNKLLTFIRCGNHKDRPAQADNLHIDIWDGGTNILRDSGTYKYNTDAEKLKYFMGSMSHNVVMVEDYSQMLKGGRFIWYYWTQQKRAFWQETNEEFIFTGEISAFQFLSKNASHIRRIQISKTRPEWVIEDSILELDNYPKIQIWHPNSPDLKIESNSELQSFKSYNSNYYGEYTDQTSIYFKFKKNILTKITLK